MENRPAGNVIIVENWGDRNLHRCPGCGDSTQISERRQATPQGSYHACASCKCEWTLSTAVPTATLAAPESAASDPAVDTTPVEQVPDGDAGDGI